MEAVIIEDMKAAIKDAWRASINVSYAAFHSSPGIMRFIYSSNNGTVNAVSP
jgi:hypothetical protein